MTDQATVLVVGGGGREHALAWRLIQSPEVGQVLVAPGNGGTANEDQMENIAIASDDLAGLAALAKARQVALTVVGPEAPLAQGIVDYFEQQGLRCFGPSQQSAQLESSKGFAKAFMQRHQIATPEALAFDQFAEASDYIQRHTLPLVIKADGLAGGKGVIIAESTEAALKGAEDLLAQGHQSILVEDYLVGEEASFIVLASGEQYLAFATSQDHKRAFDQDQGPNTGGMGAYSPAPVITEEMIKAIGREAITPTLQGMAAEGMPYRGFLYAGLLVTEDGKPWVLEFNCRFGDPEAQPIMMRLKSDLYQLCRQAVDGQLDSTDLEFDRRPALAVVMATTGYPKSYPTGDRIEGLPTQLSPDCKIFHAGTVQQPSGIQTAGGRVLTVTALGETLVDAQKKVYATCEPITWPGCFYRSDIGYRAIP